MGSGLGPHLNQHSPKDLALVVISCREFIQKAMALNSWAGTSLKSSSSSLFITHKRINKIPHIHLNELKVQYVKIFPTKDFLSRTSSIIQACSNPEFACSDFSQSPGRKYSNRMQELFGITKTNPKCS